MVDETVERRLISIYSKYAERFVKLREEVIPEHERRVRVEREKSQEKFSHGGNDILRQVMRGVVFAPEYRATCTLEELKGEFGAYRIMLDLMRETFPDVDFPTKHVETKEVTISGGSPLESAVRIE